MGNALLTQGGAALALGFLGDAPLGLMTTSQRVCFQMRSTMGALSSQPCLCASASNEFENKNAAHRQNAPKGQPYVSPGQSEAANAAKRRPGLTVEPGTIKS